MSNSGPIFLNEVEVLSSSKGHRVLTRNGLVPEEYRTLPIIDMRLYLPNPFEDTPAFVLAFESAMNTGEFKAIADSLIPAIISENVRGCRTWPQFLESLEIAMSWSTRNFLQREVIRRIIRTVKTSLFDVKAGPLQLPESDAVLDFSGISDSTELKFYSAYLFYSLREEREV